MSSSTTSAIRRSRNDFDACDTAAEAAASHDSLLVPMSSTTVYTLSAMTASLVRVRPGSRYALTAFRSTADASPEQQIRATGIGTFRMVSTDGITRLLTDRSSLSVAVPSVLRLPEVEQ